MPKRVRVFAIHNPTHELFNVIYGLFDILRIGFQSDVALASAPEKRLQVLNLGPQGTKSIEEIWRIDILVV
ncbi:MAG TPA: hypothetical protein VFR55_08930, partial [Dehalococcoidia bacterium]|nr:hypothetical protein [Dehalococcoidia bacterium]